MTRKQEVKVGERMDAGFSVFNCHLNNAKERANREFVAQFGQDAYNSSIVPYDEDGIMSIFNSAPTPHTAAWVALVTAYVNENRLPKSGESLSAHVASR